MAVDEIERTEMVQKVIDTLGEKPAATLMKCIYPDGVDFLATKDDLAASEERMRGYVDNAIGTATPSAPRWRARHGCSCSPWPASW